MLMKPNTRGDYHVWFVAYNREYDSLLFLCYKNQSKGAVKSKQKQLLIFCEKSLIADLDSFREMKF